MEYPCFNEVVKRVKELNEDIDIEPERYETEFKLPKLSDIEINEKIMPK